MSLYPLYEQDDLVFDSALIGEWGESGDEGSSVFEQSGPLSYRFIVEGEGTRAELEAHLFRIGDELFLDLFPDDPGVELNETFESHLLGVHSFFRVKQIEPTLIMSTLDYDWLRENLTKSPDAPSHVILDNRIVLTAPTEDLQSFILRNLDTEGAYGEPLELSKISEK
jgi:hypothetical protein